MDDQKGRRVLNKGQLPGPALRSSPPWESKGGLVRDQLDRIRQILALTGYLYGRAPERMLLDGAEGGASGHTRVRGHILLLIYLVAHASNQLMTDLPLSAIDVVSLIYQDSGRVVVTLRSLKNDRSIFEDTVLYRMPNRNLNPPSIT